MPQRRNNPPAAPIQAPKHRNAKRNPPVKPSRPVAPTPAETPQTEESQVETPQVETPQTEESQVEEFSIADEEPEEVRAYMNISDLVEPGNEISDETVYDSYDAYCRSVALAKKAQTLRQTKLSAFATIPLAPLPSYVNISSKMPPVFNQTVFNTCSACVVSTALQYHWGLRVRPSVSFLSYIGKVAIDMRSPNDPAGQTISTILRVPMLYNVCSQDVCPHDGPTFNMLPLAAFATENGLMTAETKPYVAKNMFLSLDNLKSALAMGSPVMISIIVYLSSANAAVKTTGVLPMPMSIENDRPLGGHSILLTGYDDPTQMFAFMNSYGTKWGSAGFGKIPYEYITNPKLAFKPQVLG